jgi:hypothetical protein
MLSRASAALMTATTVCGVLSHDASDLASFRALVDDIATEFRLEAALEINIGSYCVRFSHRRS